MTAQALDPLRPVRHPIAFVVLGICGIALTLALGIAVTHSTAWAQDETGVLSAIAAMRVPAAVGLAVFIAWLFSPPIATVLTLLLAIAIGVLSRSFKRALVFGVVVAACWAGSETMKLVVQRPRPQLSSSAIATPTSFSFPSGHTAFACALVIALLLTLRDWRLRWVAWLLGVVVVLLVAWSRMYLGVHFPTDVLASVLLTVSLGGVVIPLVVNASLPALFGRPGAERKRPGTEGAIHGSNQRSR